MTGMYTHTVHPPATCAGGDRQRHRRGAAGVGHRITVSVQQGWLGRSRGRGPGHPGRHAQGGERSPRRGGVPMTARRAASSRRSATALIPHSGGCTASASRSRTLFRKDAKSRFSAMVKSIRLLSRRRTKNQAEIARRSKTRAAAQSSSMARPEIFRLAQHPDERTRQHLVRSKSLFTQWFNNKTNY